MTKPAYDNDKLPGTVGTIVGNTLVIFFWLLGEFADFIGIVLRALHVMPKPRKG